MCKNCNITPDADEYRKIDELSRASSAPGVKWKGFAISIVKEARKFFILFLSKKKSLLKSVQSSMT